MSLLHHVSRLNQETQSYSHEYLEILTSERREVQMRSIVVPWCSEMVSPDADDVWLHQAKLPG